MENLIYSMRKKECQEILGNYSILEKNRGEPPPSRSATVNVSTGCARRAARQINTSKN